MHLKGIVLTKQKAIKYCTDSTCVELVPICCLFIHQECSENSTKWYHLSAGEHVCSSCYNHLHSFFSYEIENSDITSWKQKWLAQSQETPTIYDFITSSLLSNWYSCIECGKWRQISRDEILTRSEVNNFSCKMILQNSRNPCVIPEDQRIEFIRNHPASFFDSIKYPVYLGTSPYLNVYDEYSLDTVGISPIADRIDFDLGDPCKQFMTVFNPFSKETSTQTSAGAADPTCMDKWEYEFFPAFSSGNLRSVFLGLRNLMMLLWSANPKRTVTFNLVAKCVSLRGLARVALLINSVPDLIKIYSGFGYINFGFPDSPIFNIFEENMKKDVVVVGAGLSGLAAARHLSLLGANVTVLEANGAVVSKGKRISVKMKSFDCFNEVFGMINNPFSVLAHQCNIETREISTDLSIFDEKGNIIPDDIDQFYQNLVYNFVAYLMEEASIIIRNHSNRFEGWSLADLYRHYRRERVSPELESSSISRNGEGVENIYLSEIEYRVCGGASMDTVPHNIDLPPIGRGTFNFNYKQFSGATFESVSNGWSGALSRLFENLDVRFDSRVEQISRLGGEGAGKYLLQTAGGNQFSADKVLFAVSPWSFVRVRSEPDWLGNRSIVEEAEEQEKSAGTRPGSEFMIVQVAYDRENLFWRSKIPESTCERAFAIVPVSAEQRGFCHLFKETSAVDGVVVLQTMIFGLAAKNCAKLSDEEIINRVLDKLACLSGSGNEGGPPRPIWHEIIRNENALLACTDIGIKYNQLSVSSEYQNDIFVTNKVEILAEPISLSNSFCVGMEAASSVLKNVL